MTSRTDISSQRTEAVLSTSSPKRPRALAPHMTAFTRWECGRHQGSLGHPLQQSTAQQKTSLAQVFGGQRWVRNTKTLAHAAPKSFAPTGPPACGSMAGLVVRESGIAPRSRRPQQHPSHLAVVTSARNCCDLRKMLLYLTLCQHFNGFVLVGSK